MRRWRIVDVNGLSTLRHAHILITPRDADLIPGNAGVFRRARLSPIAPEASRFRRLDLQTICFSSIHDDPVIARKA